MSGNRSNVVDFELEKMTHERLASVIYDDNTVELQAEEKVGGGKDIGFFGGITLLSNNITGPGLITIPLLFQQSGYVTPIVAFLLIAFVSSLSATMLCSAMEKVPGNERFKGRVEFSGVCKLFFPRWLYYISVLLFIGSLIALFIASVVVSALTLDLALIAIFGKSFALEFYPHFGFATATALTEGSSGPFVNIYSISLGYMITLIATLPIGFFNLDDNVWVQKASFGILMIIFGVWIVSCFIVGLDASRLVPYRNNQFDVLGNVIFNYAFVITVPSWCNERRANVPIKKSIWYSVLCSTVFYLAIGLLGCAAFRFKDGENLIVAFVNQTHGPLNIISQVCVYLFPVVGFMSTIPVITIIIKYNLIESGLCRKWSANFWAGVFPWIISIFFCTGKMLMDGINWASICINGFINFSVPMLCYILSRKKKPKFFGEGALSTEEKERLINLPGESSGEEDDQILKNDYHVDDYHFKVLPKSKFIRPTCIAITSIVSVTITCIIAIVLNAIPHESILS